MLSVLFSFLPRSLETRVTMMIRIRAFDAENPSKAYASLVIIIQWVQCGETYLDGVMPVCE